MNNLNSISAIYARIPENEMVRGRQNIIFSEQSFRKALKNKNNTKYEECKKLYLRHHRPPLCKDHTSHEPFLQPQDQEPQDQEPEEQEPITEPQPEPQHTTPRKKAMTNDYKDRVIELQNQIISCYAEITVAKQEILEIMREEYED